MTKRRLSWGEEGVVVEMEVAVEVLVVKVLVEVVVDGDVPDIFMMINI